MKIIRINKTQGNLVFDLFDKYRVFYKQSPDPESAKNFIQARLDDDESVIFVAFSNNDQPVGFTQLYPIYSSIRVVKNWLLNDLYVEKEYRNQGIADKLIQTVMDFARQNHAAFVELSTAIDNHTAQGLYEKIGFKKTEPETDFITYRINVQG